SSYEVEKLPEEHTKSSTAELCQLANTHSLHPISLSLLEKLLNSTRVNTQPDNQLAALLCARINGSPACFAACMNSSNEYKKISPLLRKGENEINRWADRHSVERATVQAIQWLTRAPDRFSAAQFSPLLEHEKSSTQIINLLVWSGLCGWINRLKIALGETY
ncbi:CMD domain-containing protein, partial [Escherichia coli]